MSTHTLLKTARFLAISSGALLTASGQQALFAQLLSGQGSLVVNSTALRGAAPLAEDAVQGGALRFVMGAALLMTGLMLHALLGTHKQDQVRITVKPSRTKKAVQWFWVQMKI